MKKTALPKDEDILACIYERMVEALGLIREFDTNNQDTSNKEEQTICTDTN